MPRILGIFPQIFVWIYGDFSGWWARLLSFSEVLCTECQKSSALSRCAAECRAEATLVQRSIEQPVFTSHLHYPEITGRSVQSASENDTSNDVVGTAAGDCGHPRRFAAAAAPMCLKPQVPGPGEVSPEMWVPPGE